MSAFLAAVTHAPLTAVVMVSEMTSGYGLIPILVLASLSRYCIRDRFMPRFRGIIPRKICHPRICDESRSG